MYVVYQHSSKVALMLLRRLAPLYSALSQRSGCLNPKTQFPVLMLWHWMELPSRFIRERGEVSGLLINTVNGYDYIIVKVHELTL